jgi:hypothetical protein
MGDGHARFSHHLFALPPVFSSTRAVRRFAVRELTLPRRILAHARRHHFSRFATRVITLAGALGRAAPRACIA